MKSKSCFTLRPEKNVPEFIVSKEALKFNQIKSFDLVDSPAANLQREKRKLAEVERELGVKRQAYNEKRKELAKQWREIAENQIHFRGNFVKFNKFIKENHEKRSRAEEELKRESAFKAETEEKIKDLHEKVEKLKEDKAHLDVEIKNFQIYTNYLHSVVDHGSFKSPEDIINEYETLAQTRKVLGERQVEWLAELERAQMNACKYYENCCLKIVGLTTKLAGLSSVYEAVAAKTRKWDRVVVKLKEVTGVEKYEYDLAKQSIWNLCKLMLKRKKSSGEEYKIDENDVIGQIAVIKQTMKQLAEVEVILAERHQRHSSLMRKRRQYRSKSPTKRKT